MKNPLQIRKDRIRRYPAGLFTKMLETNIVRSRQAQ